VLRACDKSGSQDADCACSGDECNCTGTAGIDDSCEEQCEDVLVSAAKASNACAAAAARMQKCYDDNGCALLETSDWPCREVENEVSACRGDSDRGDATDPPPQAVGPMPSDGVSTPQTGSLVSCADGFSTGLADPPPPGSTGIICEEGRSDCSDGRAYAMTCVATSSGVLACVCVVDQTASKAFDAPAGCPTLAQMNAGCGWALSEN
jgi:hypothetical protein